MDNTVITHENLSAIQDWLNSDSAPQPQQAEPFITALLQEYHRKTGISLGRPRTAGAGGRLSMTNILMEAKREEELRSRQHAEPSAPPAPSQAHTPAPSGTGASAPAPAEPSPVLSSGELPLLNDDGYTETKLDGMRLASAIIWAYSQTTPELNRRRVISPHFVQTAMYVIYGFYLAQRKARLTEEHPQMWKFGPIFPKVYKKLQGTLVPVPDDYRDIARREPVLADFITSTVERILEQGITKTDERHRKGNSAYARWLKEQPEQWFTVIPDTYIEKEFISYLKQNKS